VIWKDGSEKLSAMGDQFTINLTLRSQKPVVIHGQNGISKKSAGEGRASHYFSETRLRASGRLEIGSKQYDVAGLAWMDHEFFTQQLDANQEGWDWFSLQLDDNTELMLFNIRRKDGSVDPYSAGTFVDAMGNSRELGMHDFQLEPIGSENWTSPETRATYPMQWKIRVPSLGIDLEATTKLPSQELSDNSKIVPSYWEGAIILTTAKSVAVRGSGYLEMTGYDHKLNMP
jgi:predicted secreted hydrolase